jgi:ubiquinol-cytochrome c reductase cytochrome b/c1 subunit
MALHHKSPYKGWVGWLDSRLPIIYTADKVVGSKHPTPRNLNYFWNFGSLLGLMLIVQIITGLFLAMNYNASVGGAFDSVERIMRDVNYGWLLRYMHAVGASMFFIVVYIHIFRGLYYGSYKKPREVLWGIGVIILLLMMATAFMGYVLPWGQMSFWGATVITNLFSAFPIVGDPIVTWLWGGFSVDNPTLNRFFALHFLLPFLILGMVFLHILALNAYGSNNPTGIEVQTEQDTIPFHPYYTVKDFFGFGVFLIFFSAFLFYAPNYLGHADNYIPADPLVTPAHIVPEWYFLPFYAILRAFVFDIPFWLIGLGLIGAQLLIVIKLLKEGKLFGSIMPALRGSKEQSHYCWIRGIFILDIVAFGCIILGLMGVAIEAKLAGVLAMFGSIIVLFFIPWLDTSEVRSCSYRPIYKWFVILFAINGIFLGWLGAMPAEGIYVVMSLIGTAYYFAHFLVIMPLMGKIEKPLPRPNSIRDAVLQNA